MRTAEYRTARRRMRATVLLTVSSFILKRAVVVPVTPFPVERPVLPFVFPRQEFVL